MLTEAGVQVSYREYTEEPLSQREIRQVLKKLGVPARSLLRRNDKAYRELSLTGDESEAELIRLMARHPTLLQRPIGVVGERAMVGRPPEALLELVT